MKIPHPFCPDDIGDEYQEDTDDDVFDNGPYCTCGAYHDEEELASCTCKACGKLVL